MKTRQTSAITICILFIAQAMIRGADTIPPSAPTNLRLVTPGSQGWTDFTPSADTRIVYVSATGSDSNNGLSTSTPVKTIDKGKSLTRHGYPDWLLLKAGETFTDLGVWQKSGRSASEMQLVSSYGTGARPICLVSANNAGFSRYMNTGSPASLDHVAVVGIDFYAKFRDPSQAGYSTTTSTGVMWMGGGNDILFEDCVFRFNGDNLVLQESNGASPKDFRFRRCLVLDSYSANDTHSQGIYTQGIVGLLIEDCVFDHNGWNESIPGAGRTIFNHNMYISLYSASSNITIRNNMIMRGSSHGLQLRTGGVTENNLFARNAISNFTGRRPEDGAFPLVPSLVRNNVVLECDDIATGALQRGWGTELLTCTTVTMEGNLMLKKLSTSLYGHPIMIDSPNTVTLTNNIIHQWPTDTSDPISVESGAVVTKVGNIIEGKRQDGTTVQFVDPNRNLGTYNASLGKTGTFDAFAQEVRKQSKANWRTEYTTDAVNNYFRAGFTVK